MICMQGVIDSINSTMHGNPFNLAKNILRTMFPGKLNCTAMGFKPWLPVSYYFCARRTYPKISGGTNCPMMMTFHNTLLKEAWIKGPCSQLRSENRPLPSQELSAIFQKENHGSTYWRYKMTHWCIQKRKGCQIWFIFFWSSVMWSEY